MKRVYIFFLFVVTTLLSICSCSSDSDPDPVPQGPPPPHLYEQDSLALVEIWKAGAGEYWTTKWDLNDFMTWGGVSGVVSNPETNEHRVVALKINSPGEELVANLSPEIVKLTELRYLYLSGKGWGGHMPKEIAELKYLREVSILDTNFEGEIPEGIFSLPELFFFQIDGSNISGELPSDITQTNPELFWIRLRYCHLSGKIPSGIKVSIDLEGNDYTEFPYEYLEKSAHPMSLRYNKITGVIPDSILNDAYKMKRLEVNVDPQQKGYGYSNEPDDW